MKELYMEDIIIMANDAVDKILFSLEGFRLETTPEKTFAIVEDEIFEFIRSKLEEVCPNDYRNHN